MKTCTVFVLGNGQGLSLPLDGAVSSTVIVFYVVQVAVHAGGTPVPIAPIEGHSLDQRRQSA